MQEIHAFTCISCISTCIYMHLYAQVGCACTDTFIFIYVRSIRVNLNVSFHLYSSWAWVACTQRLMLCMGSYNFNQEVPVHLFSFSWPIHFFFNQKGCTKYVQKLTKNREKRRFTPILLTFWSFERTYVAEIFICISMCTHA